MQEDIEVIDLVVAELREGIRATLPMIPEIARSADGLPGTQQVAEGWKVVGADDPQRRTAIDRVVLEARGVTLRAHRAGGVPSALQSTGARLRAPARRRGVHADDRQRVLPSRIPRRALRLSSRTRGGPDTLGWRRRKLTIWPMCSSDIG